MILSSLLWMMEPYYTWAQEQNGHPCRIALQPEEPVFELDNINPGDTYEESVTVIKTGSSPAQLYFAWEYVDGDPEPGDEGSLFDQLKMIVLSEGIELFSGNMNDWQYNSANPSIDDTINLTDALEMEAILQGEKITLDIRVHLPGPETGNEFQGSTLITRMVFFTICTGEDPDLDPDPDSDPAPGPDPDLIIVEPDDPAVSPDPMPEQGDPEEPGIIIIDPEPPKVNPPLPRTDGASIGLFAAGLLLMIAGISLKQEIKAKNNK